MVFTNSSVSFLYIFICDHRESTTFIHHGHLSSAILENETHYHSLQVLRFLLLVCIQCKVLCRWIILAVKNHMTTHTSDLIGIFMTAVILISPVLGDLDRNKAGWQLIITMCWDKNGSSIFSPITHTMSNQRLLSEQLKHSWINLIIIWKNSTVNRKHDVLHYTSVRLYYRQGQIDISLCSIIKVSAICRQLMTYHWATDMKQLTQTQTTIFTGLSLKHIYITSTYKKAQNLY